jgi:thiamine pyrophosphokinase
MPRPRVRPSSKDFTDGEIGFETVYKKYDPDLIIVWGKRLWNKMPNNG